MFAGRRTGPGSRGPALHRRLRPVARRHHRGDAGHPDAPHPARDLSREGRPAAPVDDAGAPDAPADRAARHVPRHGAGGARPAHRRGPRRVRRPAPARPRRLCRGRRAGHVVAVRRRPGPRGRRAVRPRGDGRRDPAVLRRDVPRRRLRPAGRRCPTSWSASASSPRPASRACRTRGSATARSSTPLVAMAVLTVVGGVLAARAFRWE